MNICLEARSSGGKSQFSRFEDLPLACFDVDHHPPVFFSLVPLGLKLLFPGFVQVNQSLVVQHKQDEVQCVCGHTDDAEVLQDKVENVAQVDGTHY